MRRKQDILGAVILLGGVLLAACKKDKVPAPEPIQPTKWEVIAGEYKVYDTTGVFLYHMSITHIRNEALKHDSLRFENFDGQFSLTQKQPGHTGNPEYYVKIGAHDLLYDTLGNRWKILIAYYDSSFNNVFRNDSIHFHFHKTNINYYIEDLIPYSDCDCKQIAVKQ